MTLIEASHAEVRLVLCTCPDHEVASTLARALVERRLAACATLLPGATSVYRWQGAIEEATEVQLLVKTVRQRLPELADAVRSLHPYELPELLVVEAGGLGPYLAWIADETVPAATPPAGVLPRSS